MAYPIDKLITCLTGDIGHFHTFTVFRFINRSDDNITKAVGYRLWQR